MRATSRGAGPGAQGQTPSRAARAAFTWDTEGPPSLPMTVDEEMRQAADTVMRAYRDGNTRQSVRLRMDTLFDMDSLYLKGAAGLLNASLPALRFFTSQLWGGESLKKVRTSFVEEQGTGTLIYREATNAMQDVAVFFLAGRSLAVSGKMQNFISNMKDRLVVLANSENAQDPFNIENRGVEFAQEQAGTVGLEICTIFQQQSYYNYKGAFNNWQLTTFRAYPYPWELWIEELDYRMVKIGESEEKPKYDYILQLMQAYEAENKVSTTKKIGKMLKDSQQAEELSEEREPGWRAKKRDF